MVTSARNQTAHQSNADIRSRRCSQHLDMLRGAAALLVLTGHLRNLFFVDFQQLTHPNSVVRVVYFVTGLGHQSVMIFFVLSGYLITHSILRALSTDTWSWQQYLVNRLTRLQVVLIPALLLCVFWDTTGIHTFGRQSIYYGNLHGANVGAHILGHTGIGVLLANAFFLQGIASIPTFGSDGPLWSLSYEFWYYILFPTALLAISSRRPLPVRLFYALAALCIAAIIGRSMVIYFLVWLMGATVAILPRPDFARLTTHGSEWRYGAGLCLLGTLIVVRTHFFASPVVEDFAVGASSAALVYALLLDSARGDRTLYQKLSSRLAGFSYTQYLVHLPLLTFLQALLIHRSRWRPDGYHATLGLLICAITVAYCYCVASVTEARTARVRRAVDSCLLRFSRRHRQRPNEVLVPVRDEAGSQGPGTGPDPLVPIPSSSPGQWLR